MSARNRSTLISFLFVLTFSNLALGDWKEAAQAIDISGGEDHTLVLTKNRSAWACGANGGYVFGYYYYGVLGTGSDSSALTENSLIRVHDGDMNAPSGFLEYINDIDAGWMHSLALESYDPCDPNYMGFVWSWGWNSEGQLGNNRIDPCTTPVQVLRGEQAPEDPNNPDPNLARIIAVSAGRSGEHSLAVDANNYAYGWGRNQEGQGSPQVVIESVRPNSRVRDTGVSTCP